MHNACELCVGACNVCLPCSYMHCGTMAHTDKVDRCRWVHLWAYSLAECFLSAARQGRRPAVPGHLPAELQHHLRALGRGMRDTEA